MDGMRALAALGVVIFHTHLGEVFYPAWLGWAGVDVFFVLSGYLITRLLIAERAETGRIALAAFYWRRATRLYPALILAVALTLLATDSTGRLGALVVLAYLADFWVATGRDLGALLHTWSLAIEEQFYLGWPLLLLAVRSRRRLTVVALALATASLVALVVWSPPLAGLDKGPYNSPFTRMWELLIGCALASSFSGKDRSRWGRLLVVASLVGTVALVAVGSAVQSSGLLVCAAALGAGSLLLVEAGRLRWLALRPLPQLGEMSYGIYLYHYPMFFIIAPDGGLGPLLLAVAATFVAAVLSYHVVEQPVRRWGRRLVEHRSGARGPSASATPVVPVNSPESLR